MRLALKCVIVLMPWFLRRRMLQWVFGYKIHPLARIRASWVFPRYLEMSAHARIGPFNVAIHLDRIVMDENATIGRGNWITGFPTGTDSRHFSHQNERVSELVMERDSAVTKNHHLDCTSRVRIGKFATVAGYQSQFLTHSVDLAGGRQSSAPIEIGDYTFVGTNVVVLGGAALPAYSVLGASSLLNKNYTTELVLYGGVPAKPIQTLDNEMKYFNRTQGFID
ncbi:putative lipopolysaccharide biosynthesis O-acetyl transferase WbbJ [Stieleria maiorica]|uniref:Putative lipopolysaccharide biosynthesis O-acetyl transferase WbbJ n=1 Tax=Stieleria maiorica TaxID=2795974 RepID=A0A5B9MI93_9BACT|nr:acyltransferase [Stieleria maiorica]QEG01053.1 putative lipopolysaccharide biosynthesis O-acetyl transferase WbbJ [Stieleria maiorica]